jgi:hypothetical protein
MASLTGQPIFTRLEASAAYWARQLLNHKAVHTFTLTNGRARIDSSVSEELNIEPRFYCCCVTTGGKMHLRIFAAAAAAMLFLAPAYAQQSHWASSNDKTAKYIIDMERKWAEGVCVDNGVVASLLAEDFQGTSTKSVHFTKTDELKDEKGARTAHDCGLDDAKVHFFSDNVAVVYGREHALGKDKSQPSARVCQVWTDTWLKRDGNWQIIASHDNRVDCK